MIKKLERARNQIVKADAQHIPPVGHQYIRAAIAILDEAIGEGVSKKGKELAKAITAETSPAEIAELFDKAIRDAVVAAAKRGEKYASTHTLELGEGKTDGLKAEILGDV